MSALSTLLAVLAGVSLGFGLWLGLLTVRNRVVVGGVTEPASVSASDRRSGMPWRSGDGIYLLAAVAVAVALIIATGLVIVGLAGAVGVLLIPRVLRARAERERAVARMQAAAEFVESIRGALGAGSGLEAAILDAARRPPDALADDLADFVAESRLPEVTTEEALRRLAERAAEPAIDLLVGSLLAALKGAAGEMGQLFERIADQGRSFAETRALTQAERAKVEFQTKVLSLLVVGVAMLSVVVSPDLTSAYDATTIGQLRLLLPALVFGFGWWWLTRMNRVESAYRFQLRAVES